LTARRVSILIVLALVTVGGIALARSGDDAGDNAGPLRQGAQRAVDGPSVPAADAASVAWYCAEGTSTADGRADETVIVANLSTEPIEAVITVMPGAERPPESQRVRIEALAQERVPVSDVLATPEPGVVVEVFGGPAVVEHELAARDDVAVGPCAREPSVDWYFAAGETALGGEEWLALFNPYGDDAIVDVTFLTDAGVQQPEATQALVVPRRARVSVAVHDIARRQEIIAIEVRARAGRVVAERSLRFDGSDGRSGLAASLGVTGSAGEWRLPVGDAQSGVTQSVAIANFGRLSTRARVRVVLAGDVSVGPQSVRVPARSVVRVDLADRVGAGGDYSVRVTAPRPVVVEAFGAWTPPALVTGVATTPGSTQVSRRWAFSVGRLGEDDDAVLTALNVGPEPVTVELLTYTAGDPNGAAGAPAEAAGPGERVVFTLSERGIEPGQVLVLQADGPIVAGREILGPGASIAPGVPFGRMRAGSG
jgi:Family of unknown function (DUF5719)